MPKLALYYYPSCPYCSMVQRALQHFGLEAELRDIHKERKWGQELIELRGRQTVPVLRIETDGGSVQYMPESRDIIRYLESLKSKN